MARTKTTTKKKTTPPKPVEKKSIYFFERRKDGWFFGEAEVPVDSLEVKETIGPHGIDMALSLMMLKFAKKGQLGY